MSRRGTGELPSGRSPHSPGWVYLMRRGDGLYKIGLSLDPQRRAEVLSAVPSFGRVELLHAVPTDDMRRTETALHEWFAPERRELEWFRLSEEQVGLFCSLTGCPLGRPEAAWFRT